jgi:hypothetical protein
MKENEVNNIEVLEAEKFTATHALITNVELTNGKKSQVVTLFNFKDVGFEEVYIGVYNALSMQEHITSMQSTLNVITDGKPKETARYAPKFFTNDNRCYQYNNKQ